MSSPSGSLCRAVVGWGLPELGWEVETCPWGTQVWWTGGCYCRGQSSEQGLLAGPGTRLGPTVWAGVRAGASGLNEASSWSLYCSALAPASAHTPAGGETHTQCTPVGIKLETRGPACALSWVLSFWIWK